MARTSHISYSCERCRKDLKSDRNTLNIVTVLSDSGYWSRLHVRIEHIHGVHNDATIEKAELCKACTVFLLNDALTRIHKGERASAGTEDIEQGRW